MSAPPTVAELIVEYNATSADTAAEKMDRGTASAGRLETANEQLSSSSREASAALGGLGQSAASSGSALGSMASGPQAAAAALGNLDARTQALRAAINPLQATQQRLNAELAEARTLYASGAIGAEEYGRAVAMLEGRLAIASKAQANMETAALRATGATRLQTHEAANLGRQFADVGVMLASGQNPFMTLLQQGPQIADIMFTSGLSIRGVARELGLMTGVLKLVEVANDANAVSNVAVAASTGAVAVASGAAAAAHGAQAVAAQAGAVAEAELAAATSAAASASGAGAAASSAVAAAHGAQAVAAQAATVAETGLAVATRGAAGGATAAGIAAAGGAAATAGLGTAATGATVALGPLALVLGVVAGVAALFAGGLAITAQQIDKTGHSAADLERRLGLNEAQMKRLKKEGHDMGVTMGDVLGGTFDFIGKKAAEAFHWDDIKKSIAEFYQSAVDWTVKAIRDMVGIWAGFHGGLLMAFMAMPATIGEFTINAVNAAIRVINKALEWITDKVNSVVGFVNAAAALVGLDIEIPRFDVAQLKELDNQFAGAGKAMGEAWERGFKDSQAKALTQFDKDVAEWLAAIDARWLERNKKAAGDAGADKKPKQEAESDFSKTMRQIAEQAVTTNDATKAQLDWNAAVASGTMTAEEANRARDWAITRAGLEAAADAKSAEEKQALKQALDALSVSYERNNAAKLVGATIERNAAQAQEIAYLQEQVRLTGELAGARDVALARFKAEQDARASGLWKAAQDPGAEGQSAREVMEANIEGAVKLAALQNQLAMGQELYNEALGATLDRLQQIDDLVSKSSRGLEDAFNGVGDGIERVVGGIGALLRAYTQYGVRREQIDRGLIISQQRVDKAYADAEITGLWDAWEAAFEANIRTMDGAARESADLQIGLYGDIAGAAKTFFKEGSEGYELLKAAEIGFRTIQFAMSVAAMAQNAAESESAIVASTGKAVSSTIAGVAKAFEQMGVWGFVGAGAILAFMAAVGVNAGGGGGGPAYDLEAIQEQQGTGSVLGSVDAKSDSIRRSLQLVADHTNDQLEYSNAMLRALRGIESNIENLAAAVARSLTLGTMSEFDGYSYNPITGRDASGEINKVLLGAGGAADWGKLAKAFSEPFGSGNILRDIFNPGPIDPLGLFDSKITKKLVDAGVEIAGQKLSDILSNGLQASYFQVLRTTREDKAFGFTYSTSTKDRTAKTPVEEELERQFGLVIGSLRTGVLEAAKVLGIDGAQAVLDAFQVNIGKISFKDMDADEIQKTLEAVFSKVGDEMAGAVLPGLTAFQKAGEGLFETLMRVARQYQVIDVTLQSVGMTFGQVGLSSLAARERLVDLFGDLDSFTEAVGFYGQTFLTEAERLAPIRAAVTAEFTRLGIAGLDTRDEFKQLVQGLDVSTAAGAELFAALMAIAPAFAAITEETQEIADARDVLSDAYARERDALMETRDTARRVFSGLGDYLGTLYRGPTAALTPEQQYMADKAEFERVRALALGGDTQALADLQGVSEAYLAASRDYFASSAGYFADLEAVRDAVTAAKGIAGQQVDTAEAQLDQLKAMVAGVLDLNETQLSVVQALANLNALLADALGYDPTPVTVTPAGTLAPTAGQTTSPPPTTDVTPAPGSGTGPGANDNSDVVAELQAMNQALTERLARLEAQLQEGMNHQGLIATEQAARDAETLEALDKTVTALRAKP